MRSMLLELHGIVVRLPNVNSLSQLQWNQFREWCLTNHSNLSCLIADCGFSPFSLLLFQVAFVVLAFLAAMFCSYPNPNQDKCPGNYTHPFKVQTVIIIAKVILWILHVCFERYVHHHHSRIRSRGYFLIYRSTRHLKRLPLVIHSTGEVNLFSCSSCQALFSGVLKDWTTLYHVLWTSEMKCFKWEVVEAILFRWAVLTFQMRVVKSFYSTKVPRSWSNKCTNLCLAASDVHLHTD